MERYKRQISVISDKGQKLISAATVLVVGSGGIGSPVLMYLAAAGVGKIIIVDHDKVELSNLHRQILFKENDIGLYKAATAQENLIKINSQIVIESYPIKFDLKLAPIVSTVDLVIDGTDNYETRYLINDVCVLNKKPFISCSVLNDIVQIALFNTKKNCYRCLYPNAPPIGTIPNCLEAGVLGTITGVAGTLTAHLALNHLLRLENNQDAVMRIFDARDYSIVTLPLKTNEHCMACQQKKIGLKELEKNIATDFGVHLEAITRNEYFIVDIREKNERDILKLEDDLHFPIKGNSNYEFFLKYKEKKILFYCATGYRSKLLASEIRQWGVNAYYLKDPVVK